MISEQFKVQRQGDEGDLIAGRDDGCDLITGRRDGCDLLAIPCEAKQGKKLASAIVKQLQHGFGGNRWTDRRTREAYRGLGEEECYTTATRK